jgi:uroporphyrinogen III methyltransferase/synthase
MKHLLEQGMIHMVTFTSSSTVTNFVEMFPEDPRPLKAWMEGVAVACIGPVTAETAKRNGFSVQVTPASYTIEALTDSVVRHFRSHNASKRT